MKHTRVQRPEASSESMRVRSFECTPWAAKERVLEEPRTAVQEPLRLASDEHVVDASLAGEAIRRVD